MSKKWIPSIFISAVIVLGACSKTAPAENTAADTDIGSPRSATSEPLTTSRPEATSPPDEAPTTTVPPTAVATSGTDAPTTTDAPGTLAELAPLTISGVSVGAGSGEFSIGIDRLPSDLDHISVSTNDGDISCNHPVLDIQEAPEGAVVTIFTWDCGSPALAQPATFGISWTHFDGRRSPIAYRSCPAGITFVDPC
jgi:hypothetical protein